MQGATKRKQLWVDFIVISYIRAIETMEKDTLAQTSIQNLTANVVSYLLEIDLLLVRRIPKQMDFIKRPSPEDGKDGTIIVANAFALVIRTDKRE